MNTKITIFVSSQAMVYGREFRMLRVNNGLSLKQIADQMTQKGWSYYPSKLYRMENMTKFTLPENEMMDLLSCFNINVLDYIEFDSKPR